MFLKKTLSQHRFSPVNHVEFSGFSVEVVRKPYKRNMSLIIRPSGRMRVYVNRSTSVKEIYAFLRIHEKWILRTQSEVRKLKEKYPPKKFMEGEEFLFLGQSKKLFFQESPKKRIQFYLQDSLLVCLCSKGERSNKEKIKKALLDFYKKEGKKTLEQRVFLYAHQMQLYPKKLSFRAQKSLWGSCSSAKHISLNWKLIAAPLWVLDYVVVHELAHLRYHNHSKRFWGLVQRHCPQWQQSKEWLDKNRYEFEFLSVKSELWEDVS